MKYYKNTELATLYHVSEKSVRNWIESTQKGKLNLELFEKDGRPYIANTTKNLTIIKDLVTERKKFTNSRGHKIITPKAEFYNLFSDKEILDIISNLDIHSEIPSQYSYYGQGAEEWHKYAQRLLHEKTPNTLKSTIDLLKINQSYIDNLLAPHTQVNIIDLGVGDCSPVKDFLEHLSHKEILGKYVAVDVSQDMIRIAQENISEWFDDKIYSESHRRDIGYEIFKDILAESSYNLDGKKPLNVVLLFGGTLSNFRLPDHALQVINNSMGREDLLFYCLKIDSESSRRYFDFSSRPERSELSAHDKFVPDLLNLDEAYYEVEQYYDSVQRSRFISLKLKIGLSLRFEFGGKEKILELAKGQNILLLRVAHKSAVEVINQFDGNGFDLMQATLTKDQGFLMTISKVKTNQGD